MHSLLVFFGAIVFIIFVYSLYNIPQDMHLARYMKSEVISRNKCHTSRMGKHQQTTTCETLYYVVDTYQYDETKYCTMEQPYPYYFYGSAQNNVMQPRLDIKKVYIAWYNQYTCYDDEIRWINNVYMIIFVVVCVVFYAFTK